MSFLSYLYVKKLRPVTASSPIIVHEASPLLYATPTPLCWLDEARARDAQAVPWASLPDGAYELHELDVSSLARSG